MKPTSRRKDEELSLRLKAIDAIDQKVEGAQRHMRAALYFVLFLWVPMILFGPLVFDGGAQTAIFAVTLVAPDCMLSSLGLDAARLSGRELPS